MAGLPRLTEGEEACHKPEYLTMAKYPEWDKTPRTLVIAMEYARYDPTQAQQFESPMHCNSTYKWL
jgi:hypothetical protein